MTQVLAEVQRALESLYRLDPAVDVRDFVISDEKREAMAPARAPREQLLLREEAGELEVGLYIDPETLRALEPGLADENLPDFLLAVEGVSHFLYVAVRAQARRPFSALELELQAEVDKFLLALVAARSTPAWQGGRDGCLGELSQAIRERIYARVRYHGDLSVEEHDRYRTANAAADEYAASLEARFLRKRDLGAMVDEMRRFYRLGCAEKLDHIARKAA